MDARALEANAEQLRSELSIDDEDVHPRVLIVKCGIELSPTRPRTGPCFTGARVYYDPTARPERQAGTMGHELGHFVNRRYGDEDSERAAAFVGAALIVPRRALVRALKRHGRDVDALRSDFRHASAELLARRIADIRDDVVVTIVDGRRVRARVAAPWMAPPGPGLTRDERDVLRRAIEQCRRVDDGWISATPVFDGDRQRVIIIAEREQLELRF